MNRQNTQQAVATENLETQMKANGHFLGAVSYDPVSDSVYDGDARDFIGKENKLVNMDALRKARVLAESGDIDKANKLKIFSNKYLQMMANKLKIDKILEETRKPYYMVGNSIVGAAGATATTDYETIRRTGDLLDGVLGQEHTNEDYQAINIAEKVDKNAVRFEYIKRSSARMIAQKGLSDYDEALPLRHTYTTGTKDIFAYGMQFVSSMRDNIDTKTDVVADFTKQVPDAMLAAKNEDVITLLNAITGTNQGDWDAFSSGIATVDASGQVQTAEDAVKAYGRPLVSVFNSDSFKGYMKNQQGVNFIREQDQIAAKSTSTAPSKTGQLVGNAGVTYFIDDALTAATYVLASKTGYMKYFQAMTIQSSYKNPKTSGQTEQRFWYDFAGFEEANTSAVYKGTSVLT